MTYRMDATQATGETLEYRALLAVSYPVFLVHVVLGRMLRLGRAAAAVPCDRRSSVLGEARALADTYIPFAFMR